jgi:hypothetical protein
LILKFVDHSKLSTALESTTSTSDVELASQVIVGNRLRVNAPQRIESVSTHLKLEERFALEADVDAEKLVDGGRLAANSTVLKKRKRIYIKHLAGKSC